MFFLSRLSQRLQINKYKFYAIFATDDVTSERSRLSSLPDIFSPPSWETYATAGSADEGLARFPAASSYPLD